MNLMDFAALHAKWYPEKTAIICDDRRLTWRQFHSRANRIANYVISAGIAKGDRIAIVAPNCLEYPEIMLGALRAGATIVPIATMLRPETVLKELVDSEAKVIFAACGFASLASGYRDAPVRVALEGAAEGWLPYEECLQAGSDEMPGVHLQPDDLYNIVYSSGTTGTPKGIVHTHQARVFFAMSCGLEFRIHNETISLVSTPLYTNGTQLIFLPTLLMGGTIVLMSSFDPISFLELVEKEKCTHAFLVPTQFIRIMEQPHFEAFDTASIEMLLSAAAPLLKSTKLEILNKFSRSKLAELYGLTEGISTVLRPDEQLTKAGSVGKPRLGGDIRIIGEDGIELPCGEAGEIVGHSPSMMSGYYRDPERTRDALWLDARGQPFIKTGDIGRFDEDGYLYLIDRKKDLIISGGFNVFPSDVEAVLLAHPAVSEAAVVGKPHREWGEVPVAFLVKKSSNIDTSNETLRNWANERLASYQKLAAVIFCEELPRNDLGKILKTELRKAAGAPVPYVPDSDG